MSLYSSSKEDKSFTFLVKDQESKKINPILKNSTGANFIRPKDIHLLAPLITGAIVLGKKGIIVIAIKELQKSIHPIFSKYSSGFSRERKIIIPNPKLPKPIYLKIKWYSPRLKCLKVSK